MTMEPTLLRNIVEGALLAAGQPLNLNRLKSLFEEDEQPERDELMAALEAIGADCEGRGFELKEVASGWRFQVREQVAPWINRLWEEKPQKYSRAILETLALVAYRQPITRGDIEEIRGVGVSSHIIKTLTEREWIKVVGQRDVPGRPSLYATTRQFLDYFNLRSLDELPSLGEIRDIGDINKVLDLNGDEAAVDADGETGSAEQAEQDEAGHELVDQDATEAQTEDSEPSDAHLDEDPELAPAPGIQPDNPEASGEPEDPLKQNTQADPESADDDESNPEADRPSL